MAEDNSSFLREVESEVRREQLKRFADKYGLPILIAAGVVFATALGFFLYVNSVREAAEQAGNTFLVAEREIRADDAGEAATELERLAAGGKGTYAALAKLQLAALELKDGKTDEAKKHLQSVAATPDLDPLLKSHAALQLIAVDIDQLDWTNAKNRLSTFTNDTDPWRHSARELLATVAYREGKYDDARQILTGLLSDQAAPQSIRDRAQILMGLVTTPEPAKAGSTGSAGGNGALKAPEQSGGEDQGRAAPKAEPERPAGETQAQ